MSSSGLQSSLNQYEELVKKQLSFNEEDNESSTTPQQNGDEEGIFDKPLTEERQQGMRAVQSTLERLDSKHGVLQRHASAECVRDGADETDYLKRTMSDSIRRSDSGSRVDETGEQSTPKAADTSSEPTRSRPSSVKSDLDVRNGLPSRIPQPEPVRPQVKTPLTTNRTVPLTSSATKVQAQDPPKPLKVQASPNGIHKDTAQESPDKAPSMRQLLVESKSESSELRRQIEQLVSENIRLKGGSDGANDHSSSSDSVSHVHGKLAESERRCDNLLREKENMATELWKLRQQVEDLMTSKSEFGSEVGDGNTAQKSHTANHQSGDSLGRERRIAELESQVVDLQEANDTSSAEVLRLDQENQMLTAHIKRLTADRDEHSDSERKILEQQISQLKLQQHQHGDDEVRHLRSELAQLRIDLKAMQEKTNILQEENVTLRENLREIKTSHRWKGSGSSVNNNLAAQDSKGGKEAAWDEINTLKRKIREFSGRTPLISPSARSADKKSLYVNGTTSARITSAYDRSDLKSSFNSREISALSSAYSPHSIKKDSFRSAYQPSNQSSDDRPPSPSGKSDISESTTVLMAGFDAYKPLSRTGMTTLPRFSPSRKLEDDAVSECTMDILNEASFNTQAYGTYDVNDDIMSERAALRRERDYSNTSSHLRRGSVGSSSVHSESTQERLAPPSTYGLRSVLVPVLPTQHNKTGAAPSRTSLSTAGRRPFAPRSPADLSIGDIAKFTKPDGRICRGAVKFIGHLHDKNETYIGLELEYQDAKHDGIYDGVRYFDCKPNCGAFITFNKVIMVWGS